MNEPHQFYDADKYEFPDDQLIGLSIDQLRAVITSNQPNATYHVDGLAGVTPVMVDYAQDQIEQARDLLLDQGVTFTDEEKDELSYISWPLTEDQIAEQEAQRIAENIERERLHALRAKHEALTLAVVSEAIDGKLQADSPRLAGITLILSDPWSRCEKRGPSGADVLELIEQLHILGARSAVLRSYCCSRLGVFENDPCPSYSVSLDLPTDPVIWLFLWAWYQQRLIRSWPTVEYLFQDGDTPSDGWAYLNKHWPEIEDPLLKALESFKPADAEAY